MIRLVTDNLRKYDELRSIFRRYNIALDRISRADFAPPDFDELEAMFAREPKLQAVLDETSQLIAHGASGHLETWRDRAHHLEPVVNRGVLRAWVRGDAGIDEQLYTREIPGWLDATRHVAATKGDGAGDGAGDSANEVFDWDALFVVAATGLTYEQMRRRGLKNSVRDLVASDFLVANLYFDERVDLRWSPRHPKRAVDFDLSVAAFLDNNEYVDRDALAPVGLTALLDSVVADGVFFRASENRRQRNYWAPGLNGGIPLTPKRDPIHEITFMIHDLMHQAIPDLVFTGVPDGADRATWRNVYSVWRMLSEAFTIALADMVFVDTLVRRGVDYDFSRRKIWPLFAVMDLEIGAGDPAELAAQLSRLLHANARYAVLGDDGGLRALSSPEKAETFESALAAYRGKYDGYFRADWRWTVGNFDAMSARPEVFRRWRALAGDELFARCGLRMLDDVARGLEADPGADLASLEGVVEAVFPIVMSDIAKRLATATPGDPETTTVNAARRFMTGQLLLFAAWDFLPKARQLGRTISATLVGPMDRAVVRRLEERFADHLEDMVARHLISEDDRRTWLGAHPLFEPSYVSYERGALADVPLAEVARACFAPPASPTATATATATIGGATFLDLGALWSSTTGLPHARRLGALLERAGVVFHDAERRFVKEPVVAICGIGGLPVRLAVVDGVARWSLAAGEPAEILSALSQMMGFAANMSYLNPRDRDPEAMYRAVAGRGHHSIAHAATLNVMFLGHSSAVEHELACQRDIVHLARLTVARTGAQDAPPITVANAGLVPVVSRLRETADRELGAVRDQAGPGLDVAEAINQLYPAAKSSALLVTGSLRSFQKLVSAMTDEGKELELRRLLRTLNDSLSALWPELFSPSPPAP